MSKSRQLHAGRLLRGRANNTSETRENRSIFWVPPTLTCSAVVANPHLDNEQAAALFFHSEMFFSRPCAWSILFSTPHVLFALQLLLTPRGREMTTIFFSTWSVFGLEHLVADPRSQFELWDIHFSRPRGQEHAHTSLWRGCCQLLLCDSYRPGFET